MTIKQIINDLNYKIVAGLASLDFTFCCSTGILVEFRRFALDLLGFSMRCSFYGVNVNEVWCSLLEDSC